MTDSPREDSDHQKQPTEGAILEALRQVKDPELGRDIVSMGMIQEIRVRDGEVSFKFVLTTPACPFRKDLEQQAQQAVLALPGVREVHAEVGADVRPFQNRATGPRPVDGVKNIIAVASNKGGVGKTTVAVNLAVALSKDGAQVGLLDADITGPNVPTMVGLPQGFQVESGEGLRPVLRYGTKITSIGFVLPKGTPVVWRGPMIGKAIDQLLHDMPWAPLDYLIIDLPPGTSDASLSMAQQAPIAGVVIVTTPQAVSLEDASKAVGMFDRLNIPIFGVIENMSYFLCPHCGERTEIFGHGGARQAAEELGLEFLGELPLDVRVRQTGDEGIPIVEADESSPAAAAFMAIAEKVAARCSVLHFLGSS